MEMKDTGKKSPGSSNPSNNDSAAGPSNNDSAAGPSNNDSAADPTDNDSAADKTFGVAFSGGGVRSAAFCSGVLRRLIKKNIVLDYLSCVSGGGYTGSAYVEWKYRESRKLTDPDATVDENNWAPDFLNEMRAKGSPYCNWQDCKKWQDCKECLIGSCALSILIVVVAIIVPIIGWCSFACPIAFVVDILYGRFVDGTLCREDEDSIDCKERTILFSVSLGVFFFFHLIEYLTFSCCENKGNYTRMKWVKLPLLLIQYISGATFAFTFFPWFINDFLQYTRISTQLLVVVISAVFWFFAPVLRKYSSLVILIYAYSYVVFWRVYKGKLICFEYSERRFKCSMGISLIMLGIFSVFGDVQLRLVHIYNRWRLRNAFYSDESRNEDCCHPNDVFLGCYCSQNKVLTLDMLTEVKPKYLSNVVANGWRREYNKKYCYVTMSPQGISVIDQQPEGSTSNDADKTEREQLEEFRKNCLKGEFRDTLKPSNVRLSSAMAMSAAALSPHIGKYESEEQKITHFLTICGLEMAGTLVPDMERYDNCKCVACRCFWNIAICAIFVVVGSLYLDTPKINFPSIAVTRWILGTIICVLLLVFLCVCVCQCCSCSCPGCCGNCHKWLLVHLPCYRFICSLLNIITDGQTPPAVMHLSDGGHFENLGLLPLLKLRLPYILVVVGSHIQSDEEYAKEIINAMEQAREILDCSFTALEDQGDYDVLTDIKNNYVSPDHKFKRRYDFKVYYSQKGDNEKFKAFSEGHIVLIAPRRQTDSEPFTWETVDETNICYNVTNESRNDVEREAAKLQWGSGPSLKEDDIEVISGFPAGLGCCDCCHVKNGCANCCSSSLVFPRHATANQFFTPRMFTAYHREGYRACMECDDFFKEFFESGKAVGSTNDTGLLPSTSTA